MTEEKDGRACRNCGKTLSGGSPRRQYCDEDCRYAFRNARMRALRRSDGREQTEEHGPAQLMFTTEVGVEIQSYFQKRLQESKTQASAGEIHEEMAGLCYEALRMLQGWVTVGKRAAFGEGCILYWIERSWQDLEPMHGQYESFHDFAVQETGEDYSTWRMKIAVYRTFILNEPNHPKIAELGSDTFLDVPIGKLQKAMGAIRRDEMTEEQWDALVDPNVNDRHFHHIMKAGSAGNSEDPDQDDFAEEGGDSRLTVAMDSGSVLYWRGRGQMGIKIGWLDVQSNDSDVREAVDAIIETASLERMS